MASDRAANFLRRLDDRRRTLREEIEDDIAPLRALTLEERGKILESVCRDAMAILRGRPDFEKVLGAQDHRSDEGIESWRKIVTDYQGDGRH